MNHCHMVLNDFLEKVFHGILRSEQKMLKNKGLLNLSVTEVHTLAQAEVFGALGAAAIAKELGIKPATLSVTLGALERKGFLVREQHILDRRRILVSLTEKGREAVDEHLKLHESMVAGVLDGLTPEEAEQLTRALKKLADFFCDR